jgi:hypothetical protein
MCYSDTGQKFFAVLIVCYDDAIGGAAKWELKSDAKLSNSDTRWETGTGTYYMPGAHEGVVILTFSTAPNENDLCAIVGIDT